MFRFSTEKNKNKKKSLNIIKTIRIYEQNWHRVFNFSFSHIATSTFFFFMSSFFPLEEKRFCSKKLLHKYNLKKKKWKGEKVVQNLR